MAPRVGLTPVTRVLGALLTALLVLGAVTVERRSPDSTPSVTAAPSAKPSPSESEEPDPESPSPSASPRDLDETIARAKAFVETYRGRPFTRDVEVRLLSGAAFQRELSGEEDDDPGEDEDDFQSTLLALGLAEPGDDLDKEEDELLNDSVLGFYDDEAERLVVRAGTLNALAEKTLVHELAHAWQDQHFDLSTLWDDVRTQDHALAVRALVEGDAQRTESAWLEVQPESVQEEIEDLEEDFAGGDPDDMSRAARTLSALFGFPYAVGEEFADELAGAARLDAAFDDPPVSTAQVLHPERYLGGDAPSNPADPVPRGRVVDRGTLGEAGLIIALSGETFTREAFEGADGWDGDEYVTWQSGARTCISVSIVMDDREERDQILEVLRDGKRERVRAVGDRAATFESCA